MRCLIVIPARLASTRLPEKLLRVAGDKTILQHTHDAACCAKLADGVVVAVDHERLAAEVERFGGRAVLTSEGCASGTDRIAEVAAGLPQTEIFINVQGDEPELAPAVIDLVTQTLLDDPAADIATVATPIRDPAVLADPNCVKVVLGADCQALYFSRAAIPHCRDGLRPDHFTAQSPLYWHHLGVYAYRREFLAWFASAPPGRLEQLEKLEQLRALEQGKRIIVAAVDAAVPGIDTQADLEAFVARQAED